MAERPTMRSGWLPLSGRELVTLIVGVALVLLAIGAGRVAQFVWREPGVEVTHSGDLLPTPARLDVNTAPEHELALLPGVGPKTARAIVDYRAAHGPFASLEDLTKVRGVGPAKLEGIRPHAMCVPASARLGPTPQAEE